MTATAMEEASPPPAAFRVLLSDGDREIHAGEVVVDATFTFQRFQSLVGDLIGVPSHRIKLYLLRQKKARSGRSPPEIRRKSPIGEGTNFAAVAREKGCTVLAQVKGTKKDRRGKGRRDRVGGGKGAGGEGYFAPEKKRALRAYRDVPLREPEGPAAAEGEVLLATAAAAYYAGAGAVCEVCSGAGAGRAAPFHWCVHDRVVAEGFRSSAGPIQRPLKSRVHASA